ncbi:MAG: KTSC domain-containing protein [Methanoregula sp.]|nr:KTSC domain-containing protein [Methanoregula sp.]
MSIVWDRHVSNRILELGYDIETKRLIVVFPDRVRRNYAPVTYGMYSALSHAMFPERFYRDTIEGKVPRIQVTEYPKSSDSVAG